jgi:hypothetical protein
VTSTQPVNLVRRCLAVAAAAVTATLAAATLALLTAAPAAAEVPVGWSEPDPVDPTVVILIAVLLPIGLALLLTVLVYGPPLARGESVKPHAPQVENQWLGGPRKAAGELAAPDGDDSRSGGASARW